MTDATIIISLILAFNFTVVGFGLWMAFKTFSTKGEKIPKATNNELLYEEENGVWFAYKGGRFIFMHSDLNVCKENAIRITK